MVFYKPINMTSPTKVILLACGSFNPVTNMHLRMFEIARDSLQKAGKYCVTGGIISPVSDGYIKKGLASGHHRCSMAKLAAQSTDWIRVDSWESELPEWSRTCRVLSHYREALENEYNANKPTQSKRRKTKNTPENFDNHPCRINTSDQSSVPKLKLLCGGDLLESFATPGLWEDDDIEEIVARYGIVVITRAGSDPRKFIYESDVLTKYQENIHIVTEWIQNEISATKIRTALRRGDSVRYLVQDSVIDYIRENQLYGAVDNKYINHIMPSPNMETSPPIMETTDISNIVFTREKDAANHATKQLVESPRTTRRCSSNQVAPAESSRPTRSQVYPLVAPDDSPRRTVTCMTEFGSIVRRVKNPCGNCHCQTMPKLFAEQKIVLPNTSVPTVEEDTTLGCREKKAAEIKVLDAKHSQFSISVGFIAKHCLQ